MNTLDISNKLKSYKNFKGVYPRDLLPNISNGTIIVNTDKSDSPGQHWVAITLTSNEPAEYFDSFGLPPLQEEILDFLCSKTKSWYYSNVTLQDTNSTTCGNYCVLYASLRCKGYKMQDILALFTKNLALNDKIIKEII